MVIASQKITSLNDAYQLLTEKLGSWLVSIVRNLPNLIAAVLLLIAMYFIARLLRRLVRRLFHGLKNEAIENLLSNIVFTIVLMAGFFISLGILNLDKTVTSLLAGAGILGLALGFAFQDIAQNFISGVSLAFRRPFNVGDTIETKGTRGVVKFLDLRTTTLVNSSGEEIFIPNKELFQNVLTNSSRGQVVGVKIVFFIPYAEDMEKVQQIVIEVLEKKWKMKDHAVHMLFTDFTNENIKCEARFSINRGEDDALAKSDAIKIIKRIMDENQIKLKVDK